MADVVATYESDSHPGKFYNICRAGDGSLYCDCPAWRFQKGKLPNERTCKHLKLYHSRLVQRTQAKYDGAPRMQAAAFTPKRKPALEKRR